jgi:hypothetical protein
MVCLDFYKNIKNRLKKSKSIKTLPAVTQFLPIQKGDRSLNPRALFGIWKDNPRTLEQFRKEGWERNDKVE